MEDVDDYYCHYCLEYYTAPHTPFIVENYFRRSRCVTLRRRAMAWYYVHSCLHPSVL